MYLQCIRPQTAFLMIGNIVGMLSCLRSITSSICSCWNFSWRSRTQCISIWVNWKQKKKKKREKKISNKIREHNQCNSSNKILKEQEKKKKKKRNTTKQKSFSQKENWSWKIKMKKKRNRTKIVSFENCTIVAAYWNMKSIKIILHSLQYTWMKNKKKNDFILKHEKQKNIKHQRNFAFFFYLHMKPITKKKKNKICERKRIEFTAKLSCHEHSTHTQFFGNKTISMGWSNTFQMCIPYIEAIFVKKDLPENNI